ncbi:MAG: aldo/keto reductase [Gemmatimonadota bacterium]
MTGTGSSTTRGSPAIYPPGRSHRPDENTHRRDTNIRLQLAPGLGISRIVAGLWQIADSERSGSPVNVDAAADAMLDWVEAGVTTFDMADHYGSAELIAGHFRRRNPSAPVQLLTKWVPPPGPITRDMVTEAIGRATERMAGPPDLLQFHPWNYADPSWLEALFLLDDARKEGKIEHLGLTNVDTAHLRIAIRTGLPIVSNQVSFSPLDLRAAGEMSQFCALEGVTLLSFGTLAGGFLSGRWLGAPDPGVGAEATWSRMKYRRFIEQAGGWDAFQSLLKTMASVSAELEVPVATVAVRYMIDHPARPAVIVGARLPDRSAIECAGALQLTIRPDARARIDQAVKSLAPIPGDCGDEYRKPPFLTASGDLSHHLSQLPAPYPINVDRRGRTHVTTGTTWETQAGFSRAVRDGSTVHVSGTTATAADRVIGGTDAEAQTDFILDKIEGVLQSLDSRASLDDIVRTRIYLHDKRDWQAVSRAHARRLGQAAPANTMLQAGIIGQGYLVEIEADATFGQSAHASRPYLMKEPTEESP